MAHLGFTRTVYKSGSADKAAARIEYITGHTIMPLDQTTRELRYLTEGREDLVKEGTRNLPTWAASAHAYFAAAERYEGGGEHRQYNAFEEWKILLPYELSRAQNEALVEDLLDTIVGTALPCTYAFHEPRTLSGSRPQPHIHLLLSARRNDEHVRTVETHFKRHNRTHPERGGAQKDETFRALGAVKAHRLMISDIVNLHLEMHGQGARVHPDSLQARGIDRTPEPKLLPSESQKYREKGIKTERVQDVLAIRQARATQPPREQNNARQYWEQRKAFLGITRDMPHAQKLAHILLKRHGRPDRVPVRYRTLLQQPPSRTQEPRRERGGQVQRLARVLVAQLDDTRAQGTLRVRLHEPEQGQGMGI